jgi:hypothetical protein
MTWFPVESTDVVAIGWEDDTTGDEMAAGKGLMAVQFHRPPGALYYYYDCPRAIYEEFIAAPSKGQYANRVLKQMGLSYERII